MRKFEIVSDEFIKYNNKNITLPFRSTKTSAGYDIVCPTNITIPANSSEVIWTNIKFICPDDEFLMICARSGLASKGINLSNGVGIIDSDYYNNSSTGGNIGIMIKNNTNSDYSFKIGDKIAQAIFIKYLTVDDEPEINHIRTGGFGSSGTNV